MNALIKKEIRLILPAWIAAMLLAIFPVWVIPVWSQTFEDVPFAPFALFLGILFLGISSFGQEFNFKTFSFLLSQPISRRRVWLVKTIVLAIAFLSILAALFVSWEIYHYCRSSRISNFASQFGDVSLCILVCFSGGLWTTLLLRQTTGAFWFTLLAPIGIGVLGGVSLDYFHSPLQMQIDIGVFILILYSIVGFFWARHLFLNAQDTQFSGGEISFSWRKKISERTNISSQPRHWISALVRKEFQLHQATILIAALVLVLHLASVVIRKVHPTFENPNVRFILETVWALWLLMPLLVGSAATAEERRLGVIELQLCLPVSRRAQLFIKFSVALILSLILGGALPLLVERTKDLDFHIFYFAATIFFISFYASTLARTTLQAIGITIGICAGLGAWVSGIGFAFDHLQNELVNPYQAFFILYLSGGMLLLVLARLAFGNFKWLHENWKLWRKNLIAIVLSLAFGFTLANGIYFRAWELLTPVEPPHGAARLNDANPVRLASNGGMISAIFPDGRFWVDSLEAVYYGNSSASKRIIGKARFIDGSDWVEVAPHWNETLGIKSDGTLWDLQSKWDESGWIPLKLRQIGSETDWSHVASGNQQNSFLVLKNDGSLWLWGTNRVKNQMLAKLAADLATPPARIGDGTNWTALFSFNWVYAEKSDESFWTWQSEREGTNSISHLIQNTNLTDEWISFILYGEYSTGVKTNGELWLLSNPPPNWNWNDGWPAYSKKIQLGENAKWKAVTFNDNSLVAIRSDGTLWKWSWTWNRNWLNDLGSIKPIQLGTHSDWINFPSRPTYGWGAVVLADDGSLWAWDAPSEHVWLAPSRKPVFVGNIFQASKNE